MTHERGNRSQDWLTTALHFGDIGLWHWDIASNLVQWSDNVEALLGLKKNSFGGKYEDFLALVHPDDVAAVSAAVTHSLATLDGYQVEFRLAADPRYFESRGKVLSESDKPSHLIGSVQDITLRRSAEISLAESEERYALAMDAVRDGLWDWNVATSDYEMSRNFYEMLGYSPEEVNEGRLEWFLSILHPDDGQRVADLLQAHFEGKTEEYVAEYRWRHKNGEYRRALSRGRLVSRLPDGSPLRMVGTTIDITDRRLLEERLLAAQKLEAIGRLAGGVAHDFNNLLTSIVGRLHFIKKKGLPDDVGRDFAEIEIAVDRASRLTSQLLAFARKRMVRPQVLEANELLKGLCSLLDSILGEHIRVVFDIKDRQSSISIDPTQLEQIIVNLALNARDAMPKGGTLTISTSEVDASANVGAREKLPTGRYWRLRVADTGVGMSEETLAHLYEPFFTTKADTKGTGLGLASSYGIVKQSGGHIDVHSKLGEGTSFDLYFPLLE